MSAVPAAAARAQRLSLLLCATLTVMAGATIAPSLPGIEVRFSHLDHAALLARLVLTMPALTIAMCAPLAGVLADRIGRRPVLITAILLYSLAGSSGLLLDSLYGILAGRALLGVAVAGVMTTVTALAGDYYSGDARSRFLGQQSAFIGLGGMLCLTAGGLLAELHWRAPFAVYAVALVLLPAVLRFLREPARTQQPGPTKVIAAPPRHPRIAVLCVFAAATLFSIAFYLVPTQLPFYLQRLGVDGARYSGMAIAVSTTMSAIVALQYARVSRRLGFVGMFALGFALFAGSYQLIAHAAGYAGVLLALLVTGAAMGTLMPNLSAATIHLAPPALRGRYAGALTASLYLGQFISPLLSQPWIEAHDYRAAYGDMGLLLGLLALCAVAVLLYDARRRGEPSAEILSK
jgi:MFS family permease